ncbi:MAG: TA system antitoxin ParD family protein [Candidatus Rokuibacteriota bacterium]
MRSAVKVSERLLGLAKQEAKATNRSITGQIEHWAILGRAAEALEAYADVLRLKRTGHALPIPTDVGREAVHELLARLADHRDRESLKAKLGASGTPLYESDPAHPGLIVEVASDGSRVPGRFVERRFVPAE